MTTVTLERDGHVLLIGLNRPHKRNSFNREMLADLSRAYAVLESDDELRAGVLFAHGDHFTAGLDLIDVAPGIAAGESVQPADGRDPFRLDGPWQTPLIAVAHGWCMTLGIELLLAADIRIAAAGTRFTQLEVQRGIYPFGGATIRLPREAGWGNAMRWLLTGDEFDAAEAYRLGLVQEVADDAATAQARAREIAATIAERAAPLGVRATLASAHLARTRGEAAAIERLRPAAAELFASADAAEGVQSFVERRQARFQGR
ncbi:MULTISPECIES: crotonase/enoyl-CoA hydratase family protein [Mycobacterium]|uniref:Enoyl-CoA hydratase n=1 Tax=Mycobacterium kiyosense TaxID=2871094 RepID=A0A9P3UZM9_9MYCO|nr:MULTISPECIES: crotonase/enoyl-CoA hydratase family protein [Mycobacterium]BDB40044.1 enoyl-CoA hydratase [Mycobacterium kiyosense]BDE11882.1 enoyl-CoA hydratase [Mycobacterium sp. 20KCMC460]GLB84883.1 enoyl-CoA hydratase [Mycobacterium kiyosense]GLB91899.1 enoyl-CoA hydratase [Mycobacterium kiyosense]GLB97917.1 enoyl-CoA hydratase [Mycobacterium kiyosense]